MESSPKRRKITLSLEFDDDAFSPPDPRDKIVQAWETAALSLFSQSSSGKPETGATQAVRVSENLVGSDFRFSFSRFQDIFAQQLSENAFSFSLELTNFNI